MDHFVGQFWKLGFCSVSECPIFAHRGQLWKFLDCEHVASIPTWNLPKHACTNHQNPFLMHGFHSMPWLGIQQVSLKACRRWDSMFHRLMNIARINKPSASLDSVHRDSARVGLYSASMDKGSFFCQFWKLEFFSVSECEIFAHRIQLKGDCRSSRLEQILVANYYSMCSCRELCYLLWGVELDLFPIIVKQEIYFFFVLIKAKGFVNLYMEVNWS